MGKQGKPIDHWLTRRPTCA